MTNQDLIHRLNRVTGQIEAIKRNLDSDDKAECLKNIQQLKAIIEALKKFGQAYIETKVDKCLATTSQEEMGTRLHEIIQATFSI